MLGFADHELARAIGRCSTGEVIVAGDTQGTIAGTGNAGGYDAFLAKFNQEGCCGRLLPRRRAC